MEAIYEALDKKAENDWSDWTFEQYLDEQGLRTAYEQAKTKLRVDKVMGVTAGAALGAWALGRNGGNFVIGKGKQYANAVMNRAVRPFGRTVKAVGTEINETMIKPTGEFVGAVAMAPFRLVGWAGGKIKGLFTGGGGHGGGHH